jgi:hypothetical protein
LISDVFRVIKYGDTSARCTSFGPYFNNGNQNSFYIELAQTENYYGERLCNQASFTVGFTRGEADIFGNSQPIAATIATVTLFEI